MTDHPAPSRTHSPAVGETSAEPTKERYTGECPHCRFAEEHHWWGPALAPARSHCDRCHRSWASGRECHCGGCCRHFDHVNAFDAHQMEGQCHDPATLTRRDGRTRFEELTRPFGTVWRIKPTRPNRFLTQRP